MGVSQTLSSWSNALKTALAVSPECGLYSDGTGLCVGQLWPQPGDARVHTGLHTLRHTGPAHAVAPHSHTCTQTLHIRTYSILTITNRVHTHTNKVTALPTGAPFLHNQSKTETTNTTTHYYGTSHLISILWPAHTRERSHQLYSEFSACLFSINAAI